MSGNLSSYQWTLAPFLDFPLLEYSLLLGPLTHLNHKEVDYTLQTDKGETTSCKQRNWKLERLFAA